MLPNWNLIRKLLCDNLRSLIIIDCVTDQVRLLFKVQCLTKYINMVYTSMEISIFNVANIDEGTSLMGQNIDGQYLRQTVLIILLEPLKICQYTSHQNLNNIIKSS